MTAGNSGREDFEVRLVSAPPDEVAALLSPQVASSPELTVVLVHVKNRSRPVPVRVDPATIRLKPKSGEILSPLSRVVVESLNEGLGFRMLIPYLNPVEAKQGEARTGVAVFKLPPGADTSSAEAEIQVDLGAEGQCPVTSRLF
jgi:hypothetical protein